MTFDQTVSYIWLQQIFLIVFYIWLNDYEIIETISDGAIAYEMVRPVDIYSRWLCQITATRLAGVSLRGGPTLIVALFLLPYPYNLSLPPDIIQFVWFLLSFILSLGVIVTFTTLIYTTLFYTLSVLGIRIIVSSLALFMSGAIIPIPFFPEPFRTVALLLPFASMQDMPLRIYSGHITGTDILQGIAMQIFWLLILMTLGRVVIGRALKNVVAQGG